MGWEKRRVGDARGRAVCDVFVWEMAGGLRFTVAGLAKGFANAYPQTPAPLSNLHFLPCPPTDARRVLHEKVKSEHSHAEFR